MGLKKQQLDFAADAFQPASSDTIQRVRELAEEMLTIERRLEKWATEAKRLQDRYNAIQTTLLPDIMTEAGLKEFKLITGDTVSVAPFTHASIPSTSAIEAADAEERAVLEARRTQALAWLKKAGGESLIKTGIKATFGKGQTKAAMKFFLQISKAGYEATLDQNVHPQTLNKYVRECIEQGIDVPVEPLSLHTGNRAKIVKPKGVKQ